jgi:hypothetical protein
MHSRLQLFYYVITVGQVIKKFCQKQASGLYFFLSSWMYDKVRIESKNLYFPLYLLPL